VSGVEFLDLTKILNISATGAFLETSRPMKADHLVQLTIPAPSSAEGGSHSPGTPPIVARVRRQQSNGESQLVGVEFLTPIGDSAGTS
jgi:hypothetical protein